MSESTTIAPGDQVQVREPYEGLVRGDWLLPGETIYVLSVDGRDGRARVRCPASGVDAWVDLDLLVQPPTCPVCDAPLTHVGATCPDARLSAHRAHEDH